MKNVQSVVAALAVSAVFAVSVARADVPAEYKTCEKEVTKYCPKAKDTKAITSCLEKREKMGKGKSGLSAECHETLEGMEGSAHEKHEAAPEK